MRRFANNLDPDEMIGQEQDLAINAISQALLTLHKLIDLLNLDDNSIENAAADADILIELALETDSLAKLAEYGKALHTYFSTATKHSNRLQDAIDLFMDNEDKIIRSREVDEIEEYEQRYYPRR